MKPYSFQVEAVQAAVKSHRGAIVMPTGSGKSVTMALLINALQVKTLVIVPNLNLKEQLKQTFTTFFGNLNNITVENIDSTSLTNQKDFDLLIIDEAHHVAAKTYRKLNKTAWKSIYYRFFFTATPFRSRAEENILFESIAGKVIYQLTHKQALEHGAICPIESYYYELPKTEVHSNTWAGVYAELIVANPSRNAAISGIVASLKQADISTLCLVKEIKHGEILAEMSDSFFAHGNNEDTPGLIKLFNDTKLKTLIGTTGVLGEGVDTKPAEFVIIAGLGKSKNAFMQQVGRGFRTFKGKESCKIILFLDRSHKWTKEHYKAQCKYLLEEYGVVPTEIKFD